MPTDPPTSIHRANASSETKLKQKTTRYRAGEFVFKEGERSSELYLLLKGAVEVIKNGESIARIAEPYSYFGEMAALLNEPRTASVRVVEDAEFVKVPGDKIESIIDVSPVIGKKIMTALSRRLLDTNKQWTAMDLELKKTKDKLLKEQIQAAQDYKRLLFVIALVFKELRLPQIKQLFDFAKDSSPLSNFATKLDLDLRHFDRYDFIRKLVEKEQHPSGTQAPPPA